MRKNTINLEYWFWLKKTQVVMWSSSIRTSSYNLHENNSLNCQALDCSEVRAFNCPHSISIAGNLFISRFICIGMEAYLNHSAIGCSRMVFLLSLSEINLRCERLSNKSTPMRYFGFRKFPGSSCDCNDHEEFVINLPSIVQGHLVL